MAASCKPLWLGGWKHKTRAVSNREGRSWYHCMIDALVMAETTWKCSEIAALKLCVCGDIKVMKLENWKVLALDRKAWNDLFEKNKTHKML
jgi:hypothetical protein